MWCSLKSRDTFVVIPKPQMEAALHLANHEEFDINAVDHFCDVVANYKMNEASSEGNEHPSYGMMGEIGKPHSHWVCFCYVLDLFCDVVVNERSIFRGK
jgi:hypothetical protein